MPGLRLPQWYHRGVKCSDGPALIREINHGIGVGEASHGVHLATERMGSIRGGLRGYERGRSPLAESAHKPTQYLRLQVPKEGQEQAPLGREQGGD
jgi:hypothetical protein